MKYLLTSKLIFNIPNTYRILTEKLIEFNAAIVFYCVTRFLYITLTRMNWKYTYTYTNIYKNGIELSSGMCMDFYHTYKYI